MTKKEIIIWGIVILVVALIVIGSIFIPKLLKEKNNNSELVKHIEFNSSIPYDYFPKPKPKPTPPPAPVKKVENKPKPKPTPPPAPVKKVDYTTLFSDEENDEKNLRQKQQNILSELMNKSFNEDSNVLQEEKAIETPQSNNTKEEKTNPYITAKDYGKEKNMASAYVDLKRTIGLNTMIAANILPTINSSLAGTVTAQIEDHVYAEHGRNILIPKGSKAYGKYIPLKKIGDERLAISWFKIRTPEGVNINLQADSADVMGRSGVVGDLDNRWFERFGLALSFSTISNVISFSAVDGETTTTTTSTTTSLRDEIIKDYKKDLASIADQIIKEQKVIPIQQIPAGTRIYIIPIDDIWFLQAENNLVDVRLVHPIDLEQGE
jgi:type IV secretory pathway VirB10-like protein